MVYQNISKQLDNIIIFHIDGKIPERNDAIENYDMMFDNGSAIYNLLKMFDKIISELGITDIQIKRAILIRLFRMGFDQTYEIYFNAARNVINSDEGPSNPVPSSPVNLIKRSRSGEPPTAPRKMTIHEQRRREIARTLEQIDEEYVSKAPITRPPATKEQKELKKNNPLKYYEHGNDCVICIDPLDNGNSVCMLYECEHLFHCKCLKNPHTKEYYKVCPMCRTPFLPANLININLHPPPPPEPSGSTTTDGTTLRDIGEPEVNSYGSSFKSDLKYLKSLCTKARKADR